MPPKVEMSFYLAPKWSGPIHLFKHPGLSKNLIFPRLVECVQVMCRLDLVVEDRF